MEEHKSAHDGLKDLRIERLLSRNSGIQVYGVTLLARVERRKEDPVAVEEPDIEKHDLQSRDDKCVGEIELMGEATENGNSQDAQKGEKGKSSEVDE